MEDHATAPDLRTRAHICVSPTGISGSVMDTGRVAVDLCGDLNNGPRGYRTSSGLGDIWAGNEVKGSWFSVPQLGKMHRDDFHLTLILRVDYLELHFYSENCGREHWRVWDFRRKYISCVELHLLHSLLHHAHREHRLAPINQERGEDADRKCSEARKAHAHHTAHFLWTELRLQGHCILFSSTMVGRRNLFQAPGLAWCGLHRWGY